MFYVSSRGTSSVVRSGVNSDFYQVTAAAGTQLTFTTTTPGDGPGEFVNTLDPILRLYDAAGNEVASNDNGATDGRNSMLTFTPPANGTYYVEVTSAGGTNGEYALAVAGATATWAPFQVIGTTPVEGAVLTGPPSQIMATTNGNILLPTLQGSDLTVDGVVAAAVTPIGGSTMNFTTRPVFQSSAADGVNDHYYLLTSNAETWTDAEAEAAALGGHLVSITNQAEQDFLDKAFLSGASRGQVYWIGLNDAAAEGTFVWSSGEPVSYTDWYWGEPNDYYTGEDYGVVNWQYGNGFTGDLSARGAWNDTNNDNYSSDPIFAGSSHVLRGIIELDDQPAGSWLASDGTHTVAIAGGAISNVQGTPIDPFSSTFVIDTAAPRIVSSSIQQDEVLTAGDVSVTLTFSEPMNTGASGFSLYGSFTGTYYYASSSGFDDTGTVFTATFSNLPEDAYTFTAWGTSFQDSVGLWLDGEASGWPIGPNATGNGIEGGDFIVKFATDADTRALPTPFVDLPPAGAQVQQTPYATSGTHRDCGRHRRLHDHAQRWPKGYGRRDRRPEPDRKHRVRRSRWTDRRNGHGHCGWQRGHSADAARDQHRSVHNPC